VECSSGCPNLALAAVVELRAVFLPASLTSEVATTAACAYLAQSSFYHNLCACIFRAAKPVQRQLLKFVFSSTMQAARKSVDVMEDYER